MKVECRGRIGERNIMNNVLEAEIIRYEGCFNVTVKFIDSGVRRSGILGKVACPGLDILEDK